MLATRAARTTETERVITALDLQITQYGHPRGRSSLVTSSKASRWSSVKPCRSVSVADGVDAALHKQGIRHADHVSVPAVVVEAG